MIEAFVRYAHAKSNTRQTNYTDIYLIVLKSRDFVGGIQLELKGQ